MARINQALLDRLEVKLGVKRARLYALIQEVSHNKLVDRHVGALILAGQNGISIQKYSTLEERAQMRGIPHDAPIVAAPPTSLPPRSAARHGGVRRFAKTKENTVFVVHGRDHKLRDSMYQFLGALGLKPREWGHAIRAARGGNP